MLPYPMHAFCSGYNIPVAQSELSFVYRAENKQSNHKTMAYNLLKGKKGIIFGALNNQSIAWKVAERAHEEGAEIVLTNAPIALRMGTINDLAEKINAEVISADATSLEDLENLIDKSMEVLGSTMTSGPPMPTASWNSLSAPTKWARRDDLESNNCNLFSNSTAASR